MPVFDYQCTECGKNYDLYHKVREVKEDIVCPSCGSTNHKKLMSVPNVSTGGKSNADFSPESCPARGSCGGSCEMN
jgi:putative FmdB family regulatory protein